MLKAENLNESEDTVASVLTRLPNFQEFSIGWLKIGRPSPNVMTTYTRMLT